MWIDAAYRGRGLRDGDEIMSISGKMLKDMKPGACVNLFRIAAADSEKKGVEIEVLAKGEKTTRKVIVTKAPFNEVLVTKSPIDTQVPSLLPLPEPVPRDKNL
jgi:hypothetical protein